MFICATFIYVSCVITIHYVWRRCMTAREFFSRLENTRLLASCTTRARWIKEWKFKARMEIYCAKIDFRNSTKLRNFLNLIFDPFFPPGYESAITMMNALIWASHVNKSLECNIHNYRSPGCRCWSAFFPFEISLVQYTLRIKFWRSEITLWSHLQWG